MKYKPVYKLMLKTKRSCNNNCVFCFINQLPKGMRKSVYFKDDDSRLSFLYGNYITLTNLSEHDVDRIIKMRTPVNVSVHSTNPDLRVKLMGNPNAGATLALLYKFADVGIPLNCQLVLCPGLNDGDELIRSLKDLTSLKSVSSIACVPVGLTKFRNDFANGYTLPPLRTFSKEEAVEVIEAVNEYEKVYAADEFYLKAGLPIPEYEHYGTFPQYENGVGMWAYMKKTFIDAVGDRSAIPSNRRVSIVTGTAAQPLISELVEPFKNVKVFPVRNDFFGHNITISGLLTGGDIIAQLSGCNLGEEILIGANMLNANRVFLDDVTVSQIETALGVRVRVVDIDGAALYNAVIDKIIK